MKSKVQGIDPFLPWNLPRAAWSFLRNSGKRISTRVLLGTSWRYKQFKHQQTNNFGDDFVGNQLKMCFKEIYKTTHNGII